MKWLYLQNNAYHEFDEVLFAHSISTLHKIREKTISDDSQILDDVILTEL